MPDHQEIFGGETSLTRVSIPQPRVPQASVVWARPAGLGGSAALIRVGSGVDDDERYRCPTRQAVKARPGLKAAASLKVAEPPMPLGVVMDVLDRIEYNGDDVAAALAAERDNAESHEGLGRYVEHAVNMYLRTAATLVGLQPRRPWWVVQHAGTEVRELWAWGRRYQSADGDVREFRFLRLGSADAVRRGRAAVAVAAYVAACGNEAAWPRYWDNAFEPAHVCRPATVVVSEVGLVDGSRCELFHGPAAEAVALYEAVGRAAVARVVAGAGTRPGGDCLKCRLAGACLDLLRAPGLLGLPTYRRSPLRQVSVSDLRYHTRCPAQYHLRAMHLPRSGEYGPAARLGQAVHEFLEDCHRVATGPCRELDMPADVGWAGAGWELDADHTAAGVRILAHHPQVCPLHSDVHGVRVEPTLAFHDTAAQALVIAKPDLIYREDQAWIWRETKTSQRIADSRDVMETFPQLALATAVLASGVLGGSVDGSRVELEILRPQGSDVILIDPTDPEQVGHAHAVLRGLAGPWREDTSYAARPGRECRTCPVHRWCPSAADAAPQPPPEEPAHDAAARPA